MSEQNPGNRSSGDKLSVRQAAAGVLLASIGLSSACMPAPPIRQHTYSFTVECPPDAPDLEDPLSIQANYLWNSSLRVDLACTNNRDAIAEPLSIIQSHLPRNISVPSQHLITLAVTDPASTHATTSISRYDFNITIASSQPGADFQFQEGSIDDKRLSHQQISPLGDQP